MGLAERLGKRRAEIEQVALVRVYAVSDPGEVEDPEYTLGLREAVRAAVAYAVAAVESAGRDPLAPVPDQLLAQARAAARNDVSIDTVLRRYSAGYALLGDFLVREAQDAEPLAAAELKRGLRAIAEVFDRLVASISDVYVRENEERLPDAAHRRAERVRRLLAGEPAGTEDLNYQFDAWHLAAIAAGPDAAEALRDLAAAVGRNLLLARAEGGKTVWAWLGGRGRFAARELLQHGERTLPGEVLLALGEPGRGMEGWRLSHRQAKAAMAVLQRGHQRRTCYADVALLASALRDEVLAGSLRQIYLAPLEGGQDGGVTLRKTLVAYFAAQRNASSTAAAMGVSRQTVNRRLRAAEARIGRPVDACAAELETALKLCELTPAPAS
jgi:PucR C-terminal helix-turn-helix domain/GGDEF-like domain